MTMNAQLASKEQLPLDFSDEFGLDRSSDRHGSDARMEEGGDEGRDEDGRPEPATREVKRRRQRRACGRENYARLGAASLAAKIQLVMAPSEYAHPELEVGVRVVGEREVRRTGLGTARLRTYATVTDARETAVEWAEAMDIWADGRPVREQAFLWGLTEWHQEQWVTARRLFAAAGEPKWSRAALRAWDASTLRTFPHEIEFPSRAYETFAKYGEAYGRFYFGGAWQDALPRESRAPLWP
jgi:hypothetical protein